MIPPRDRLEEWAREKERERQKLVRGVVAAFVMWIEKKEAENVGDQINVERYEG